MLKTTQPQFYTRLPSPIGELLLIGDGIALTDLYTPGSFKSSVLADDAVPDDAVFRAVSRELHAYFAGELTSFETPVAPRGTPFQQQVWSALVQIPYGTTTSYGLLAASLNNPAAARAVGLANARNPISIIIPCHRLLGSSGSLVKYGGGLERKRWLLDLEARVASTSPASKLIATRA